MTWVINCRTNELGYQPVSEGGRRLSKSQRSEPKMAKIERGTIAEAVREALCTQ